MSVFRELISDDELHARSYADVMGLESDPEDDEFPYSTAYDLHMGICDLFAKALQDAFGYEMARIDYDSSFHYFCRTDKDGTTCYIDASGISTNLKDLQPGKNVVLANVRRVDAISLDAPYSGEGLLFAKRFIELNYEHYKIDGAGQLHYFRE